MPHKFHGEYNEMNNLNEIKLKAAALHYRKITSAR